MQKRHAWRSAAVLAVLAVGLMATAMAGTAVAAPPPVGVTGSVAYSADNHGTYGGCYHAVSTSAVDAKVQPGGPLGQFLRGGLPLKGTLTIDFSSDGSQLCGAPSSFRFTSPVGAVTGPVTGVATNCNGSDPSPTNVCGLSLWLNATDGTGLFKLFHVYTGPLLVQVSFKVVSGDFYSGSFGTAGPGTITGTLQ
jgi:opacity protein-like surface antigen